jgi:hypothetical protein
MLEYLCHLLGGQDIRQLHRDLKFLNGEVLSVTDAVDPTIDPSTHSLAKLETRKFLAASHGQT